MEANRPICGKPGRISGWICGRPPEHSGPCALYEVPEASDVHQR